MEFYVCWIYFIIGFTVSIVILVSIISLIRDADNYDSDFSRPFGFSEPILKGTPACRGRIPSDYNWQFIWDNDAVSSYKQWYKVKFSKNLGNNTLSKLKIPRFFNMDEEIVRRSIRKFSPVVSIERIEMKYSYTDIATIQSRLNRVLQEIITIKELKNHSATVNSREIALKQELYEGVFDISGAHQRTRVAYFQDVLINNLGLIFDPKNCHHVINAGCLFKKKISNKVLKTPKTYQNVIYLTGVSGMNTWHFPMECLVALSAINREVMRNFLVHVNVRSDYILRWLELLNISSNRVIGDEIAFVKNLVVPEQGRCARPFFLQVAWLVEQLENPSRIPPDKRPLGLVYIKRSSRGIKNTIQVERFLKEFSKRYDYELKIHDDRKLLPLREQIEMFLNVDIVVGPHGAGLTFVAFLPQNSCVIEVIPDAKDLGFICYARLAFFRNLNYWQFKMDKSSQADIRSIQSSLHQCLLVQGKKFTEQRFDAVSLNRNFTGRGSKSNVIMKAGSLVGRRKGGR